jgi:hypothetical protein
LTPDHLDPTNARENSLDPRLSLSCGSCRVRRRRPQDEDDDDQDACGHHAAHLNDVNHVAF